MNDTDSQCTRAGTDGLRRFADAWDGTTGELSSFQTGTIGGEAVLGDEVWAGRQVSGIVEIDRYLFAKLHDFADMYERARQAASSRLADDAATLYATAGNVRELADDLDTTDSANARDLDACGP